MIILKATGEFIADLFTPGVCGIHECVEGLPLGAEIINVTYDCSSSIVTFVFDDGTTEETKISIKYTRPIPA